ncbi:hypothetical protein SBOR_9219 [Sclerotinia borealis F-4128]|uniref:Uncharacterized protein n=1 Tax=Sclerotinia borealis (strain F-4128) TaxID=1432307 RepID=W9C3W7_SCLBF|nr:hypothetical protein SBOR_9219 [Sclerotinia borealis F-4128]
MLFAILLSIYLAVPSLPPTPPGYIAVIALFEAGTVTHFLAAAVSSNMPGNRKTNLPLFPEEDMKYLSKIMWSGHLNHMAWHVTNTSCSLVIYGSLSQPENVEVALSQIQLVVDVFEYLHTPPVQGRLRDIYNQIWIELDYLQDALDVLEVENGRFIPVYSLSALWQEYIQSYLYENMTFQSRSFIFTNLRPLYNTAYFEFLNQTISISGEAEIYLTSRDQSRVLNRILDLYIETEFYVTPHTVGFILDNENDSWQENNAIYEEVEKARRDDFQADYQEKIEKVTEARVKNDEHPQFVQKQEATLRIWDMLDRAKAHQVAQLQILNPSKVEEEDWVRDLRNVDKFGYVIYKMNSGQSDEVWKNFLNILNDGLDSGWDGMVGVEDIRQKATLYWVNADDAGIPEGDIIAAKKHFQTMVASQFIPANLSTTTFLTVDSAAIASFVSASEQDKNHTRGFVKVVSADFDPASNSITGYNGTFKIIDQLVWTELYPLGEHLKCATLDAHWALARNHTEELYVGATTAVQRSR